MDLKRFLAAHPRPERALSVILHDVEDPVNVGTAFRTADAVGVSQVILTGITPRPPHKLIDRVGRKKHKRVPWTYVPDVLDAIAAVKKDEYSVFALEITAAAQPYQDYEFPARTCLVAGHEDHGVPRKVLERCDGAIYLPMYGKGASLNVAVALSVASYRVMHP